MNIGYIGQRARRQRRNLLLVIFFSILIGSVVFFSYQDSRIEIVSELEKINTKKQQDTLINDLENKIFELDQKLILREKLIDSLKKENKVINIANDQLTNENKVLFFETQQANNNNNKNEDLKNNKTVIKKLNIEIKKIKDNLFSLKEENELINSQISIIEKNNSKLELEKNDYLKKIDQLEKIIIEKDLLIKKIKDNQHH